MKSEKAERGCTGFTPKLRAKKPARATAKQRVGVQVPAPFHDPRNLLAPRRDRLLLEEIAHLERLLRTMRPKDPSRPQVVRRLAEGYAELAAAAERKVFLQEQHAEEAAKSGSAEPERRSPKKERPSGEQRRSPYPTQL